MWKKFLNLFTILTLFSLLMAPVGRVSAQESGPFSKKMPLRAIGDTSTFPAPPAPSVPAALSKQSTTPGASDIQTITGNLVPDPSFEASYNVPTPIWGQESTNFGSPLCNPDPAACGNGGGTAGPRTGNIWAWFGGVDFTEPGRVSPEIGQVYQDVTFPSCGGATLQFYFWIGQAPAGSGADDVFLVGIDGIAIFAADATQRNSYSSYKLVSIDVSGYADGGVHFLQFYSEISDQIVTFNLDDVSLTGCPGISGNAGVAGATINYTGGSTTTNGSGNYTFDVPPGWSGTVTPSHACFTFSPVNRTYNNVRTNQTAQNYTANPGSGCARVAFTIKGVQQGVRSLPKNSAGSFSFPVDAGPVQVNSTNSVPFIPSQRVIFPKGGNNPTSFSELLGLPASQVGTRVSFPAYDNNNFNSQLHIANIGNSTATVRLLLKGSEIKSGCTPSNSPFTIAKGTSIRVSCPGNEGPLVLDSPGVLIVASLRITPKSNNGSYSEIMGLPQKQADTGFVFPWYNNATLNTQLRVANIGAAPTNVTVTIGGVQMAGTPFNVPANTSKRISFAGINGGPVRVTSSGGVPIVASIRVLFPKSGATPFTAFSEVMGLPQKLVGTTYHFPWYNNATLDAQLRVANVSASPATVHILIGGQEVAGSPFTLAAGAVTSRSFAGVSKGPVKVESNQNIVASLRVLLPKNVATPTYFSEVIGLPHSLLSTNYYFPWYNNVNLDTQIRIGVP